MREPLTPAEIAGGKPPGWEVVDGKLARSFDLPSFVSALAFVQAVGTIAEELDHHPDIDIRWRQVRLAVNTHSAGGAITELDLKLALRVNACPAAAAG